MTSRKKAPITNYAQRMYNHHFACVRRRAKEENLDLLFLISKILPNASTYVFMLGGSSPMPPPDTSKMKRRKRELCLKEWYRPYYYEWFINDTWYLTEGGFKSRKGTQKGGKDTGEKTKKKCAARKAPIRRKRKKLLDSGVKEKDVLKRLVKHFWQRDYDEIQKTNLAEKHKEADERRLQKPPALSP